jgi:hypothetical protein
MPTEVNGNTLTLESGVVIEFSKVSPFVIRKRLMLLKEPKVPTVMIEAKGRAEENPFDPDYLAALASFREERGDLIIDCCVVLGSKLVSVPEGFPRPEDQSWVDDLALIGLTDVPENPKLRYLYWVRNVAMAGVDDFSGMMKIINGQQGISEEEVMEAAKAFRSDSSRDADMGISFAEASPDGNIIRPITAGNGA